MLVARPYPALSISRMHVQTSPGGGSQRLPFGTGQLEVLHITRVRSRLEQPGMHEDDKAFVRGLLHVEGTPGSSRSSMRKARLAFVDQGTDPPLSHVDPALGLLRIYYPMAAYTEVCELLKNGERRMCYCWRSADSARSVVMLMAMR